MTRKFLGICLLICAASSASALDAQDKKFVAYDQTVIAFTHAQVIDGTGAAPLMDQTLLVQDGRIAAMGPAKKVKVPDGAAIIDAAGKTLLPGFVMMHEHLFYTTGQTYTAQPYSFPRLYLAGGTTTARTAGSMTPYQDINIGRAVDHGDMIGPDFDITGPYLNGASHYLVMHQLTDAADATKTVNFWADQGATSFKAYTDITRAELKAAIDAAHARGLKITAHLCSVTFREAADMGIDNLEHAFEVASDFSPNKQPDVCPPGTQQSLATMDIHGPQAKSLIDYMISHHVALTSTLAVLETFGPGRPKTPARALDMLNPELRKAYEAGYANAQTSQKLKPYAAEFTNLLAMEKMFVDAGGVMMVGTDPTGYGGVIPGFSGKREIELLVEAGFTFPQALKMATLNGAHFLGRDHDIGSLAVGKRADILLVDGDPMKDAAAVENIHFVFKKGIGYSSDAIFAAMKGQVGYN